MGHPCELCGSESMKYIFTKHGNNYEKCPSCKLVRVFPQPSDEELDAIYQNHYYQIWGDNEEDYRTLKFRTFEKLLDLVPLDLRGGRLLDIGAATGLFMELASRRGYDTYGVEISEDGAKAIEEKFGVGKLIGRDLEKITPQIGKETSCFDIVVMADLFEHLRDPNRSLEKVNQFVRKGGGVLLYLPDTSSLAQLILRKRWDYFCKEHLFHYSRKNIGTLLKKYGFEVLEIDVLPKFLSLEYAYRVMKFQYGNSLVPKILHAMMQILPKKIHSIPLKTYPGQICCLAIKR